jgi:hypothetical protein
MIAIKIVWVLPGLLAFEVLSLFILSDGALLFGEVPAQPFVHFIHSGVTDSCLCKFTHA